MSSLHITPEETNHYNSEDFIPLFIENKIRLLQTLGKILEHQVIWEKARLQISAS